LNDSSCSKETREERICGFSAVSTVGMEGRIAQNQRKGNCGGFAANFYRYGAVRQSSIAVTKWERLLLGDKGGIRLARHTPRTRCRYVSASLAPAPALLQARDGKKVQSIVLMV
jgi:hypothetical protein